MHGNFANFGPTCSKIPFAVLTVFRHSTGSSRSCRQVSGWSNPFIGNGFPSRAARHITVSLASLMHWNCVRSTAQIRLAASCTERWKASQICSLIPAKVKGSSATLRICAHVGRAELSTTRPNSQKLVIDIPSLGQHSSPHHSIACLASLLCGPKGASFWNYACTRKEHGSGMPNSETERRRRPCSGQATAMGSSRNIVRDQPKKPLSRYCWSAVLVQW